MGRLFFLKLLYLLLVLNKLVLKLLDALTLLRSQLRAYPDTFRTLPLFGRVLHALQE